MQSPPQPLLYVDYRNLVIQTYREKSEDGTLPIYLMRPTAAGLRRECITVYAERYNTKDERCLRAFFGAAQEGSFQRVIANCHRDIFIPLVNFLRNPAIETDQKNLELLAWLLDFRPRPFVTGMRLQGAEVIIPHTAKAEVITREDETIAISSDRHPPGITNWRKLTAVGIVMIILILGGYLGVAFLGRGAKDPAGTGCMYWTGTEYQPTPCTPKGGDTLAIAANPLLLEKFKKITRMDTVTRYSIGKLWYVRIDGGIELYTMKAPYPVGKSRSFFKLSRYMYEKHIEPLHIK